MFHWLGRVNQLLKSTQWMLPRLDNILAKLPMMLVATLAPQVFACDRCASLIVLCFCLTCGSGLSPNVLQLIYPVKRIPSYLPGIVHVSCFSLSCTT